MPDLGTYDIAGLREAHSKLRPPDAKWAKVAEATLDVVQQHAPSEVPVGTFRRLTKEWAEKRRMQAAAWRWLRPQDEPDLHDKLPDLQLKFDLAHLSHDGFCRRLMGACEDLVDDHPEMRTYSKARIAEAEFRLSRPNHQTVDLHGEFGLSILQLNNMANLHRDDPEMARDLAFRTVRSALGSICRQVAGDLDPKPRHNRVMNANLMVPVPCSSPEDLQHRLASFRGPAADKAAELWQDFGKWDPHQALVVIAETSQGPGFQGFWVPDVRHDGRPLPGAPRALVTGEVQRLISSDLPPFPIPDAGIRDRWVSYMRGDQPKSFTFDACVSVPVRSRSANMGVDQPVGVVNVNLQTNGLWPRVLSRSWRELVARNVEAWSAVLWSGLGIVLAVDHCVLESSPALPLPALVPEFGDLVANSGKIPMLETSTTKRLTPGESDDE